MDITSMILFNLLSFVTDIYSSTVNLVTEPVQNNSLSLTCTYAGNESVDYFVWYYYAPSANILDVVRNDSCKSTVKPDARFINLKYKFRCSDINSNTIIFERLSYDMLIEAMSCSVRTIEQDISSNDRLLFTYMVLYHGEILHNEINDVVQFRCLPLPDEDTLTFIRNGSYRPYVETKTELEWSFLNYFVKRSNNSTTIYCTDNYTSVAYPSTTDAYTTTTDTYTSITDAYTTTTDAYTATTDAYTTTTDAYTTTTDAFTATITAYHGILSTAYTAATNTYSTTTDVYPLTSTSIVLVTSCQKKVDTRTGKSPGTNVSCSLFVTDTLGFISSNYSSMGTCVQQMNSCLRTDIEEIQHIIDSINGGNSSEEIDRILLKTLEVTTEYDSDSYLHYEQLTTIIQALEKLSHLQDWTVTHNQPLNFMRIVSNLLDTRTRVAWRNISNDVQDMKNVYKGVRRLLNIVSAFTTILRRTIDEAGSNKEQTIQTENVLLQVIQMNSSVGLTFPDANNYHYFDNTSTLQLSTDSLKGSELFSGILYKNLSGLLSAETTYNSFKDSFLNSAVIGAMLDNWRNNTDFKVTITFHHLKEGNWQKICGFMTENSTKWMTEGCYVKTSDSTSTTCECNHLTNFAILMNPWTENNVETKVLRIITLTGCSLSTFCLLITVMVHLYMWRYLKSDRATILMHLCVAMVTSYVIFLGGVDRTDNTDLCTTVAVLLQYIYLVVFFLMLAEGIEISIAVLYVFATKPRIKWILSAAWVIPAFIVGITLAITKMKGYGTQHFCWLSVDNGLIWAFVGPALIIILINSVLLGFVIRAVFNVKKMTQKQTLAKIVAGIRCLCILLPLLGCTWVIGIFYVNKSTSWIQYLFSFCNGCQGVVIFIFHCALNKQITNAYEKKQRKYKSSLSLNPSAKLHRLPKRTKYLSASALFLVNSETAISGSHLSDKDIANNGENFADNIEMKRFGPIKDLAEEKRSSLKKRCTQSKE